MFATVLITVACTVIGTLVAEGLFLWIMIYALARRMFGKL